MRDEERAQLRVLVTTAPADSATQLARGLLEARLIGCANLLPSVRALYWWEGEIQDDEEVFMWMECSASRVDAAVAALTRAHPYDVPKVLVLLPEDAHPPYAAWLEKVSGVGGPRVLR